MLPQMREAIGVKSLRLKEQASTCTETGQGDSCGKDFHRYFLFVFHKQ